VRVFLERPREPGLSSAALSSAAVWVVFVATCADASPSSRVLALSAGSMGPLPGASCPLPAPLPAVSCSAATAPLLGGRRGNAEVKRDHEAVALLAGDGGFEGRHREAGPASPAGKRWRPCARPCSCWQVSELEPGSSRPLAAAAQQGTGPSSGKASLRLGTVQLCSLPSSRA